MILRVFLSRQTFLTINLYRYHTVAPVAEQQIVPTSDSTLINGQGRYPGGPATPLAVINVLPNKRYRFRLISISCDPNFTFSIDGHPLVSLPILFSFDAANLLMLFPDNHRSRFRECATTRRR